MATTAEYGIGKFTFPRGWFMVGETSEATNKPIPLRYFGRDLIMYRGESGRVVVMDAYCPHMKTHLAKNESSYIVMDGKQVEGDDIRCPYHAWKFGLTGCAMRFLTHLPQFLRPQKFVAIPFKNGAGLF